MSLRWINQRKKRREEARLESHTTLRTERGRKPLVLSDAKSDRTSIGVIDVSNITNLKSADDVKSDNDRNVKNDHNGSRYSADDGDIFGVMTR